MMHTNRAHMQHAEIGFPQTIGGPKNSIIGTKFESFINIVLAWLLQGSRPRSLIFAPVATHRPNGEADQALATTKAIEFDC
jgi:hypothetical protein